MIKVVAQNKEKADILMYGYIGSWEAITASSIARTLAEIQAQGYKEVNMRVHSPGGDVYEGLALYGLIQTVSIDVNVTIEGIAASMMSVVMLAAKERRMAKSAMVMIHEPKGYKFGSAKKMRDAADTIEGLKKQMAKLYAAKTGKTEQYVLENWMPDEKDVWFTAEQAKEAGLVDEIIEDIVPVPEGASPDAVMASFDKVMNGFSDFSKQNTMVNQKIKGLATLLGLEALALQDKDEAQMIALIEGKVKDLQAQVLDAQKLKDQAERERVRAATSHLPTAIAEKYIGLIDKIGADAVIELVEQMPKPRDLMGEISASKKAASQSAHQGAGLHPEQKPKAQWSLQEWEKYDPAGLRIEMRDNPEWYADAFRSEYGDSF